MSCTYSQAVDEIYTQFATVWNAGATAIVGTVPEVRYQDREDGAKLPQGVYWCRISLQTISDRQSTLSNCVGTPFKRRYQTNGLVFIQLFVPKTEKDKTKGRRLAELARSAFRGKETPLKVVFSNAAIKPLPDENLFYRFNVVSEYEHDEIA